MHLLVLSAFRPTEVPVPSPRGCGVVSMHLLVLSAFRRDRDTAQSVGVLVSQCTFWCSVLSDYLLAWREDLDFPGSQCTFWCSVLSDSYPRIGRASRNDVSMHLLVLSAFRLIVFLPVIQEMVVSMHLLVLSAFRHKETNPFSLIIFRLNAPFGAQCFPTTWSKP